MHSHAGAWEREDNFQSLSPKNNMSILIRPEFNGVKLGPRILRTKTATLAAITSVQLLWGDLGK